MTGTTTLEPLNAIELARFMHFAGRRIDLHTFQGRGGADVPGETIQRHARDRGAWLVERGSFAEMLDHHIAVEDDDGALLSVAVTRADIGIDDEGDQPDTIDGGSQQAVDI